MSINMPYKNGLHYTKDWILRVTNGKIVYGFRVTLKGKISEEQKAFEIKEIIRKADDLCGNRQGNSFITTQINYDG